MSLSNRQQTYLKLMGIDVWIPRSAGAETHLPDRNGQALDTGLTNPDMAEWEVLKKQVSTCTACSLHRGRTQTVFGCGAENADWMLIGEAPGAEEDRQGKPFVGRAGRLLNSMLYAIGLQREQVYIANILKCRPPNNRDPSAEEVTSCEEYLRQQILFIKPRIILALGRIAAQNLLKTDIPIGRLRGKVYQYGESDIPLVVTYHPAYLLRSPREKRKSWQDLQLALKEFTRSRS